LRVIVNSTSIIGDCLGKYEGKTSLNSNNIEWNYREGIVFSLIASIAYIMLFQSLYLRLRSTVSRHPKVGKRWKGEKRQPSAKETKEYFGIGLV
jgi:hypothetical protein